MSQVAAMDALLMDYDSVTSNPDSEGWIQFLRDRVFFSFKTIGRLDRGTFPLLEPTLDVNFDDPTPFCESFNLWLRGLSFYAAGKIVDANEIDGLMGTVGLKQEPVDAWNSIQIKRMFRLLNTNRLDAERAMTTLFLQALEFIIKAALIHCNYYSTKKFYFPTGHKLHELYDALPDRCRLEIEREVNTFLDDFYTDREKAMSFARRIFGHSKEVGVASIVKDTKEFRAYMAGRRYFDMWQEDAPHRTDVLSDFVGESLRMCGDLVKHRYGPTPPSGEKTTSTFDSYDMNAVASARIMTRFFFEYLFGWKTIAERQRQLRNVKGSARQT